MSVFGRTMTSPDTRLHSFVTNGWTVDVRHNEKQPIFQQYVLIFKAFLKIYYNLIIFNYKCSSMFIYDAALHHFAKSSLNCFSS